MSHVQDFEITQFCTDDHCMEIPSYIVVVTGIDVDFISVRFLCSQCHSWYKIEEAEGIRYREVHGNGDAFL